MKKIILLIFLVSQLLMGREILIGDKINLAISGSSVKDIETAFQDFEIEDINKTEDGFNIAVRSYKPGNHLINIGNKRLIINIKSSLDEKDQKEIYRDLASGKLTLSKGSFPWLFTISLVSASILIVYSLNSIKRKRKFVVLSPKDKFYEGLTSLGDNPFHEISYLLREYIDSIEGTNLLSGVYKDNAKIKGLDTFLYELDHIKFSGNDFNKKEEFVTKAKELAKQVEHRVEEENNV